MPSAGSPPPPERHPPPERVTYLHGAFPVGALGRRVVAAGGRPLSVDAGGAIVVDPNQADAASVAELTVAEIRAHGERRWWYLVAALAVLAGVLWLWSGSQTRSSGGASSAPPAESVPSEVPVPENGEVERSGEAVPGDEASPRAAVGPTGTPIRTRQPRVSRTRATPSAQGRILRPGGRSTVPQMGTSPASGSGSSAADGAVTKPAKQPKQPPATPPDAGPAAVQLVPVQ